MGEYSFEAGPEFAKKLDSADALSGFRDQFHIPLHEEKEAIYLCGNSLGLQPKKAQEYVNEELEDWARMGVEGHVHARHPWMPYHEFLEKSTRNIAGAREGEVVVMNSLTVNLHLLMVSFYRPTPGRYKILIEKDAFPSDRYAVASQARFHDFDPADAIIEWGSDSDEVLPRMEELEEILEREGDQIAMCLIGGVNYYTGQFFDLQKITEMLHLKGIIAGFDLAHAAGNMELQLHDWGVDFAAWCSYKYLNSGPGALSGVFVHKRHAKWKKKPRFTGWWGHNKETRFGMRDDFDPIPGAEGWQLSNPPILPLACMRASMEIFEEAGMDRLREKSKKLTAWLEFLVDEMDDPGIRIITPRDKERRGCQLSIQVKGGDRRLYDTLTAKGVIADWREPDVIRVAPVPLYNSYDDVYQFSLLLKESIREYKKETA